MKIPIPGTYRRLLAYPRNLSWSILKHPPRPSQSNKPSGPQCLEDVTSGAPSQPAASGMLASGMLANKPLACGTLNGPPGHTTSHCLPCKTTAIDSHEETTPSSSCVPSTSSWTNSGSSLSTGVPGKGIGIRTKETAEVLSNHYRPSLNLKFELGRNIFATMLIREIMKSNV